ncbi:MAG: glycoside hydrolase family 2 [Lachnospiraceae bacterium]|nr:glycoside hydrolase family 2 [Lachnospiraceae bacterium]
MQTGNIPRPEYPRPDFKRESFQNLNGEWEFAFDDMDLGIKEKWYGTGSLPHRIKVPYVYQCEMSGIGERSFHNIVWYKKHVMITKEEGREHLILHFGAVDYKAMVWVNGSFVGEHKGGNTPFAFDITKDVVYGIENTIAVRVTDDALDLELPRGKQYWKGESEGIFYTGTTGIWQTVWLEQVADNALERIFVTPDVDRKTISIKMEFSGNENKQVRVRMSLRGEEYVDDLIRVHKNRAERSFRLDQSITLDWNHQESLVWSPENPVLFDLEFTVLANGKATDLVESYCALRKVSIQNGKFMLNNRPYYQKMLLDQGYWKPSLMTAPTDEDFVRDINACKAMGFNGVRKHQKAEDPRYLYHADRLGLIVWGEFSSAYVYSRDFACNMTREWMEVIRRDYNHPCIVCWVPLNESWGVDCIMNNGEEQDFSRAMYYLTKSLDQTRCVISNDGWDHTVSDLLTIHDYEGRYPVLKERYGGEVERILNSTPGSRTLYAQGNNYHGEPIIVSEFGGISYQKTEGVNGWGYTAANSDEDYIKRYRDVVGALLESPHVQGFVYTQLCDVEQETNGLMTYDREFKVEPQIIRDINMSGRASVCGKDGEDEA